AKARVDTETRGSHEPRLVSTSGVRREVRALARAKGVGGGRSALRSDAWHGGPAAPRVVAVNENPEIGRSIQTGPLATNYHDTGPAPEPVDGEGGTVLLLHGSGPGVSAWANWRNQLPPFARHHRVVAPDLAGFGFT